MANLEQLGRTLRECEDLHALFNFTELVELARRNLTGKIPWEALLGNLSLCLQRNTTTTVAPSYSSSATQTEVAVHPVLVAYFVVIAVFGLAINLCVIVTICRVRRLWTITNAFIVNLAMADFLMATVLVPLNIKYTLNNNGLSKAKDTLFPLLGAASLLNLAAVTLDRFMSISYPLTYGAYLNRFRSTVVITAVWLVSIFQALFRLAFDGDSNSILYEDIRFALVFALPFLCVLMANIKIYYVARQHARQISASTPEGQSRAFKKKLKIVRIISLLVGTFMLTWLPYFIQTIYCVHHPCPNKMVDVVTEALVCGTALLNPLLYGLLRKDVREAMVRGLRCQNVNQIETENFSHTLRTDEHTATGTKTRNPSGK